MPGELSAISACRVSESLPDVSQPLVRKADADLKKGSGKERETTCHFFVGDFVCPTNN